VDEDRPAAEEKPLPDDQTLPLHGGSGGFSPARPSPANAGQRGLEPYGRGASSIGASPGMPPAPARVARGRTSASQDTLAGHHCQTPSERTRVSTVGTHIARFTSTCRLVSRSVVPQAVSTSSVLISLSSWVGIARLMMGIGTSAIRELSVHSLPSQWTVPVGRGRPLSLTST